ncbi:TetR/AcrR family transcriptional regulator [Streptomyces sp. NBC_01483]|uniref:TetR/AcrR family transcriptional regulator n=1 Tax=Streptomyces sp. NBC_01483 TaxID=2903883 RepID=UPI002E31D975|nr:TetR/AcrR family transcriptional regulator [Streptomyces sp. NBC_01483]
MPVPERPKAAAPPAPSAPSAPSAPAAQSASSAPPTLRERRRATAVREILDAAELHVTENGPEGLSLRAVARSLGMTVQALYHYFPNRHALVTMLVTKGYEDLFAAVQAAVDSTADSAGGTAADSLTDRPFVSRLLDAAEGYRGWAIAHPERFKLLFGRPMRGYEAPADGASTIAARRMSTIFQNELFGGFSPEQLAAADIPSLSPQFRAHLDHLPPDGPGALPPPAITLLMEAWGRMHGMVLLEVFGHTSFLGDHQAEIFHVAMRNMLADIHRRIPGSANVVEAGAV